MRRGTDDFVAGLGNEKDDPRQTMWRLMGEVRYFHHSLDIFKQKCEDGSTAWKAPSTRCVVVANGAVVWGQGVNCRRINASMRLMVQW